MRARDPGATPRKDTLATHAQFNGVRSSRHIEPHSLTGDGITHASGMSIAYLRNELPLQRRTHIYEGLQPSHRHKPLY
jgi:hypothetical protein